MQRLREVRLWILSAVAVGAFGLLPGCARISVSRVFLQGETVDSMSGKRIPYAVVRWGDWETVADETGHYRFLRLVECIEGPAGIAGHSNDELAGFAPGYLSHRVGFHLDKIEALGISGCPKDVTKYLQVQFVPNDLPKRGIAPLNPYGGSGVPADTQIWKD